MLVCTYYQHSTGNGLHQRVIGYRVITDARSMSRKMFLSPQFDAEIAIVMEEGKTRPRRLQAKGQRASTALTERLLGSVEHRARA